MHTPRQQLIIDERAALYEKIKALYGSFTGAEFIDLPEDEQAKQQATLAGMRQRYEELNKEISDFPEPDTTEE